MEIKHRVYNGVLFVNLTGELDECSANYTRESLDGLFDSEKFSEVVLDFSELAFMDSTGIGVVIGRYKKLKERQIPIYIANTSAQIERIFKMTGIFDLMPKLSWEK